MFFFQWFSCFRGCHGSPEHVVDDDAAILRMLA